MRTVRSGCFTTSRRWSLSRSWSKLTLFD